MSVGKISSLGIGSDVLNYDIIEKLRKADESAQVEPIDKKIQENIDRQAELIQLKTSINLLKNNAKNLADFSSYLSREVKINDDNIKASVSSGALIQDIELKVDSIAKNSINEFGRKFAEKDSKFSSKHSTLLLNINAKEYKISLNASDTIEEVAQKITDGTHGIIVGSIIKTGSGDKSYSIMINAKNTGAAGEVYFGKNIYSKNIHDGALDLKENALKIIFKDNNLQNVELNIGNISSPLTSSQYENLQFLQQKIQEELRTKIGNDEQYQELLKHIHIDIAADRKSLILNDARGLDILTVEDNPIFFTNSIPSNEFQLPQTTSTQDYEELIVGKSIHGGKIEGSINVLGQVINLARLTSSSNTSSENAKEIQQRLNEIEGLKVEIGDQDNLIIKSNKPVKILKIEEKDDEENNKKNAEAFSKIGINPGEHISYADAYKSIFLVQNIQHASDAAFTYNGISITRAKNNIDDIVKGLNIELLAPTTKNVNISITRNNASIIDEIKGLVENYNLLIPKIDELTRYDEDTKISGVFNGVTDIITIKTIVNRALNYSIREKDTYLGINKFGLYFNENGTLALDESKLRSSLNSDVDKVVSFFRGNEANLETRTPARDGVFTILLKELDNLVSGPNARLKLFEEKLVNDDKRLKEERKKNIESLDNRYESLAKKFASYDAQISKAKNSFGSLNMMIEQSLARKQ